MATHLLYTCGHTSVVDPWRTPGDSPVETPCPRCQPPANTPTPRELRASLRNNGFDWQLVLTPAELALPLDPGSHHGIDCLADWLSAPENPRACIYEAARVASVLAQHAAREKRA